MGFWEQFAITIFQGLLAGLHVNTSQTGTLAKILIPIRDSLIALYPLTPTQTTPTSPTQ
jgi:hypothetical protein